MPEKRADRNACDFILPCGFKALQDFEDLFLKMEAAGFVGMAFEFKDMQWKHDAALTDSQWKKRRQIG